MIKMAKLFDVKIRFEGKKLHSIKSDDPDSLVEEVGLFMRGKFRK